MAEPRKVQFVTLSAFAAGSAAESRKRRLEDEADFNFDGDGEVEATATGAGGANGRFGKTGDRDKAEARRKITVRLNVSLSEPNDHSSAEFNYSELVQNLQAKNNAPGLTSASDPNDPFNDEERERLQVEALAKKFENKYGNTGKKKRKDRMQDLIDIGFGYDETDPFIDNSEAYDELVPASLTTKLGGFYINTGTLQFRQASDSEGEEADKVRVGEQVIKKRKKKEVNSLEDKKPKKNRVPKQGVTPLNLHRPEKKKRKKLMKDSLCLAAMLRRFTREKEEIRKRTPSTVHPGLGRGAANKPHSAASTNHLLASDSAHPQANTANNDVSLADLTSDPAVMSLLGSANEKELQDLLGDLDFSLLDTAPQHVMATARENGLLGVGVPVPKAAGGGGQGRGLGSSSSLYSPPPLPDGLPAPLIKRIEDLRAASRQFDQEGRKKFFTLDMNDILLDIELQVQEQPLEVRSGIYSHMEAFVPCNKEALLKRLKKLSLNIQDDRLRTPLLKLKLAVCSVMPEQIARYNMDCMAKVAKQQSEEGEKNGSEEEDEEKPGKRVMGPRKKFVWDDKLRNLLCSLVRVKLSCYELESQCSLSVEDYLKAFMENEVKPLWPKGWMQARILFKESRAEGLWIQKPPLPMTSTPSLHTSSSPALPSARQPPSSSPSEPICLSDSLDEDLTAPSLDSISHALALLSNASKGLGPSDSPLSPPPLHIPTSSPPSITPHYPSASQPSSVMGGGSKLHPQPSPSPPKQRPPPTASPLLPPHQKGFTSPPGVLGTMGAPQGLAKSSAKVSSVSSNGGAVSSSITPSSSPSSRSNSSSHPGLQAHAAHHHQKPNFITPMQATLTKSSHSSNSSPIIKLTPRPPAPTPPPSSSSSPSPSSSPSNPLSHTQMIPSQQQQHQYSAKTSGFRPPFSVPGGGPLKQSQGSCSFAGGQKAQSISSSSSINNNNNNNMGVISSGSSHPDNSPSPSSSLVSANHGQRQRAVGGASQGSKAGNSRAASGTLATPSATSHLSQVSTAGTPLLGSPPALPLGFGMLGGLVPVSLPFQFPPLLNFSSPGAPGAGSMGSAPSSNSGYSLAQNDLMGE
uniref:Ubinuclein 2a n=1 Tax=Myripristis murdjan TaxID=586833 RepID=A0A668AQI1_9TELE